MLQLSEWLLGCSGDVFDELNESLCVKAGQAGRLPVVNACGSSAVGLLADVGALSNG